LYLKQQQLEQRQQQRLGRHDDHVLGVVVFF
jgi:hypothetical protein